MTIYPAFIVRAYKSDTTLVQCYPYTMKEAGRAIRLYCSMPDVQEVIALDYCTLEVLSHWVKKGKKAIWHTNEYGIF